MTTTGLTIKKKGKRIEVDSQKYNNDEKVQKAYAEVDSMMVMRSFFETLGEHYKKKYSCS